ncbi:hypothetical protein E2C01_056407 [Portunus trituberculatus]|uniref:Uncharacterized protein n=1 Tax=Portunus trituberculatus TaxID=210409 RepID=A0A5B7GXB0_PORTR|nr:hypothetical protein [Portunus trituberculatus]
MHPLPLAYVFAARDSTVDPRTSSNIDYYRSASSPGLLSLCTLAGQLFDLLTFTDYVKSAGTMYSYRQVIREPVTTEVNIVGHTTPASPAYVADVAFNTSPM